MFWGLRFSTFHQQLLSTSKAQFVSHFFGCGCKLKNQDLAVNFTSWWALSFTFNPLRAYQQQRNSWSFQRDQNISKIVPLRLMTVTTDLYLDKPKNAFRQWTKLWIYLSFLAWEVSLFLYSPFGQSSCHYQMFISNVVHYAVNYLITHWRKSFVTLLVTL